MQVSFDFSSVKRVLANPTLCGYLQDETNVDKDFAESCIHRLTVQKEDMKKVERFVSTTSNNSDEAFALTYYRGFLDGVTADINEDYDMVVWGRNTDTRKPRERKPKLGPCIPPSY